MNSYYELLKKAQKDKLSINKKTLLQIKKLYQDIGKDLVKKLESADNINNAYIKAYMKYVNAELKGIENQIEELIKKGISETSQLSSNVNGDFFSQIIKEFDLDIDSDLLEGLYRPNFKVIDKIISGGLYKDNKSLSDRIWRYNKNNLDKVQQILLDGMIQKKPLQDICDQLKAYTDGGNSKVKAINKAYGSMNANALRLVRTSLNHAFTETMKDECRYNPFVEGYQWILSGMHSERMKNGDICDDYANHDEGLGRGVFKKGNIPFAHQNCMCIQVAYIPKSFDDIGSEINSWIHGKENKGIDKWVEKTRSK